MKPIRFLEVSPGHLTRLVGGNGLAERCHEFDEPSIGAVNAALAAKRPLLVRGEPGIGKTQLAEAVASELRRAFYPFVVDARTESSDLLWRYDAVMRLAHAQLCAILGHDKATVENQLAVSNFVCPGPLWWAFDWKSAKAATRGGPTPLEVRQNDEVKENGWVVLIDEIDKAESDVPNGLLEVLGSGQFSPFGRVAPITNQGIAPLVIITTNEERLLPDAFVRRCLVLHLELPSSEDALVDHLRRRGRAHFGTRTGDDILVEAARQLVIDRKSAEQDNLSPLPGQAEYLDLVRAVVELAPGNAKAQWEILASAARFTFRKHPQMSKKPVG